MELDIIGRNQAITDRFRAYATEKAEKIALLADRALALEIKASRENDSRATAGGEKVELTLIGKGPLVRAEAVGGDTYSAFDIALNRLLERVRRAKDKKKVHRGQHRPTSLRDAASDGFSSVAVTPAESDILEKVRTGAIATLEEETPEQEEEQPYSPVVIRKKVFASVSMTVDDAVDFMELVGHDFYLFIDSDTDRPSVVYRRKGWDYGVIGLGDESDELADQTDR